MIKKPLEHIVGLTGYMLEDLNADEDKPKCLTINGAFYDAKALTAVHKGQEVLVAHVQAGYAHVVPKLSEIVNPSVSWMRYRTSARYHGTPLVGGTGTITVTPNFLYAFAFCVPNKQTFDRIAIWVTTLSAGLARLGVYADDGNCYPANLVLDAGTVDLSTTGLKEITIDLTLERGLYWLAMVTGVTPTLGGRTAIYTFAPIGSQNPYSTAGNYWFLPFTFEALPSTFPSGAMSGATIVTVSLRKA